YYRHGGILEYVLRQLRGSAAELPGRTDRPQPGLAPQLLELLERQRQQQIDPPTQQHKRVPERRLLGGSITLDLRGVRHAPVSQDRLPGEDGARFLRTIAHGHDEVPMLALQAVDTTRRMAGPRDAVLAQHLDREGVHLRRGPGASAVG